MVYRISQLHFSIMSPEMVKNLARVRIVTADLYDADGYPVEGGVMDPRLGVVDPGLSCRTCGGGIGDCPGHLGYLELAKPVIHVLYTKTIHQLLKITCKKCCRIMVVGEQAKRRKIPRITLDNEDSGGDFDSVINPPQTCPHCNGKQKKITFVKPYAYYEDKDELSPTMIRERFEKIPDKDLKSIGFNGGRPEWLILTLFPVPPVTMRPSITLEGGERSEDDLTHKLVDIVRINQSLKENIDIGAPEFILNDLWELVEYHVSTYFDNELSGAPLARHRSGRALKGLIQRLKAKEGRIRGNLLGKRVNFSARTVISPDPRLSINEVGVPEFVARELTMPVYVSALNMKEIKELITSEKVNYVVRPDGRRVKVTKENMKDILEALAPNWVVERQLQDGDPVLFNRQPSLHRISIMVHRVKVMPYQTFRLNPSVCFPYNADFDGDEMNLHVPQSEEARTEAAMLMEVHKNIISPKFGGPVIALDLDQITGISMLTRHGTVLTKDETAQLLGLAGIDADLPDQQAFTGKEIFSLLLPAGLNISGIKTKYCTAKELTAPEEAMHDAVVEIVNGRLLKGVIDVASVGAEKGKLIHAIFRVVGPDGCRDFINKAGKLSSTYLTYRGFSVGISDFDLPAAAQKDVTAEIRRAEIEADELIQKHKEGQLTALPGMTLEASLEAQIMNALSNGVSRVSEVVSRNIQRGDLVHMFRAGSKGSLINTTQMAAVVGQETILGKRVKRGYYKRTLPHLKKSDLSPQAHGFVARGFKDGLNPFELFWNIMNGREGLMDKSLRTRKSGYMQRRLMNALQDLTVREDLSVRNAHNQIVQFRAGEDGIDPSKSDWGKLQWREKLEVSWKG